MYSDPSGCFWDTVFDVGFIIWGIVDLVNGGYKDWKNWVAGSKVDNIIDTTSAINKLDNLHDFRRVTMIGETMDRVKDGARAMGITDNLYDTWKGYDNMISLGKIKRATTISKAHNGLWLYNKLRSGYVVIDGGIDIYRTTGRSAYYLLESRILKIWKYRQIIKAPINMF